MAGSPGRMYSRANEMMLTMNSTGTMLTSRRKMYSRMEPLQVLRRVYLILGRHDASHPYRSIACRGAMHRARPGLRSLVRAARLADHQRDGYRPVPLGDLAAVDQGEQGIGGHLPQLDQRVADGGEGRCGVARRRDIVEADEGHVFGDADAGLVAGTNHANRGAVV